MHFEADVDAVEAVQELGFAPAESEKRVRVE